MSPYTLTFCKVVSRVLRLHSRVLRLTFLALFFKCKKRPRRCLEFDGRWHFHNELLRRGAAGPPSFMTWSPTLRTHWSSAECAHVTGNSVSIRWRGGDRTVTVLLPLQGHKTSYDTGRKSLTLVIASQQKDAARRGRGH